MSVNEVVENGQVGTSGNTGKQNPAQAAVTEDGARVLSAGGGTVGYEKFTVNLYLPVDKQTASAESSYESESVLPQRKVTTSFTSWLMAAQVMPDEYQDILNCLAGTYRRSGRFQANLKPGGTCIEMFLFDVNGGGDILRLGSGRAKGLLMSELIDLKKEAVEAGLITGVVRR